MTELKIQTGKMETEEIHLGSLKKGTPGITPEVGGSLAQAAAVCLEKQKHTSGKEMRIDGDFKSMFMVFWEEVTQQMRLCWADFQDATEWGACGMAVLLVERLASLTVVERAYKGGGFDYWLGADDGSLFQRKKRLEVSGILQGNEGDIRYRVGRKLRQTDRSRTELPAVVVVVEFGEPRSRIVQK